ncbi:MAG: hypothetical protein ACKVU4_07450 [Phycisphaerales bacterium]
MPNRHPTTRTTLKMLAALGALSFVTLEAGCGWTARDEYRRAQKVTLTAQPGDGSMGVFALEADPAPVRMNSAVASVPDDR